MLSSLLLILFPAGLLAEPGDKCDAWQVLSDFNILFCVGLEISGSRIDQKCFKSFQVGNLWQVGYDANLVFIVDHTVIVFGTLS